MKGGAAYKVGWIRGRGRCGTVCKGTCPWMWGYRCKAGCAGLSGVRNWWLEGKAPAVIADSGSPEASCLHTWHSQVLAAGSACGEKSPAHSEARMENGSRASPMLLSSHTAIHGQQAQSTPLLARGLLVSDMRDPRAQNGRNLKRGVHVPCPSGGLHPGLSEERRGDW